MTDTRSSHDTGALIEELQTLIGLAKDTRVSAEGIGMRISNNWPQYESMIAALRSPDVAAEAGHTQIGDAIIAGIASADTALEQMSEIVTHLERAGFAIVPRGDAQGARDKADYKIGWWLSAALEDPAVCAEMKADINTWFEAHQPGLVISSTMRGTP